MRRVLVAESGCWEWQGVRDPRGYGFFHIHGDEYRAHRVAYEMLNGEYPGALMVCHSCDNPACVNPGHLWLGTARDNALDMLAKGRAAHQRLREQQALGPRQCLKCGHHRTDDYTESRRGRPVTRCRNCVRIRDAKAFARRKQQLTNQHENAA